MPTPFGPQLIGETEKTLNALLRQVLAGRLTEPQWVTLRVSLLLAEKVDSDDELVTEVTARAHFTDAGSLVAELKHRGLLEEGKLTQAGRALVAEVQTEIANLTGPIWDSLPSADVAVAGNVLNAVLSHGRAVLAS